MITTGARAYVSWGRWVADCPNPGCTSAEEIHPSSGYRCGHVGCRQDAYPQPQFHCTLCHAIDSIEWPADPEGIWVALQERPNDPNRNWFPVGHELAARCNAPDGQTPDDLRAEHRAMAGQG